MLTFQELLYKKEKERGEEVYLRQALDWEWREFTWKEVMLQARKVATFLKNLGLKKGDKVASLSRNCAEWFILDFGIMLTGMVHAPLYSTLHKDKVRYILDHCEAKVLFLGRLDKAKYLEQGIPKDIVRVDMGYYLDVDVEHYWKDILKDYEPMRENYIPDMSDLSSLVYTSGTTGDPKGVMITYEMWAHLRSIIEEDVESGLYPIPEKADFLSFLPLAHIAERVAVEYASLSTDAHTTVSFIDTVETFIENLRDTQPTFFFAVPRIWVQLQLGVLRRIEQKKIDRILKIPILRTLFKRRIRRALGLNKSLYNASGAAPISRSVLEWWKKLGVEISEVYGQTESMAVATFTPQGKTKFGKVGVARAKTELKIAQNGELLIRNDTGTVGYYKNPEASEKLYTKDGFVKTGDKVEIDEDGYVSIIGRVKDTFKTDKGEFVDPVPIENEFQSNEYVEQLCLLGLNLVQPVMVIQLNNDGKNESRKVVEQSLIDTLNQINPKLTGWQKISHIFIARDEWEPENELMTATLKIRRNKMAERYTEKIKNLANKKNKVIWE